MSEIDTLLRTPRELTIGAETYTLRPLTVRAVPVISRCIGPLWADLTQRPDLLANHAALAGWMLLHLPPLIEERLDDLLALLAMATGKPAEQIADLPLDEFVQLLLAVQEDARDFFTRKVLPSLKTAWSRGDGATSSTPSSPPATTATH